MEASWARVLRCAVPGGRDLESFTAFLETLGVDSVDVVLAISEHDPDEFFRGLLVLSRGRTPPAEGWEQAVAGYREQLATLFVVAQMMGPAASAQNARDLYAELHVRSSGGARAMPPGGPVRTPASRKTSARSRTPATRRMPASTAAPLDQSGVPSLRTAEVELKRKWVQRLLAIHDRAGEAAKIGSEVHDAADIAKVPVAVMMEVALGRGAWRTIRGHVLGWLRFERWAAGAVYPPTLSLMVAFAAHLQQRGAGPSVVPAFRATVAWIGKRLSMTVPDPDAEALMAIEAAIVEISGRELREAVPMCLQSLRALEKLLVIWDSEGRVERTVRVFQVLCMVWGSLRFDDALHVRPDTVKDSEHALRMTAWQTKVDRRRAGTRYAVPKVGLTDADWVHVGLEAWQKAFPDSYYECDFWLVAGSLDVLAPAAPLQLQDFVAILRHMLREAAEINPCAVDDPFVRAEMDVNAQNATGHTPRVTAIDLMAHDGADQLPVQMQGSWKSADMPCKYVRDRKAIPVAYLTRMAQDLRTSFELVAPPGVSAEAITDETPEQAEQEDEPRAMGSAGDICFWESRRAEADQGSNLRFHVVSAAEPGKLSCNIMPLSRCRPLGAAWPERGRLCVKCQARRPDAALLQDS